ncbi:hypothetical protein DHEL01_v205486 [Diaporthe helianthi]|uniref:Uncharacterized protein n=1 Tax=Diaporthe helianthi TaxID=158607 RepID=A0A2P5I0W1_DIAHE|nr:hypothetical protein DHEL01_v205486 [Diaporthe helianthi]
MAARAAGASPPTARGTSFLSARRIKHWHAELSTVHGSEYEGASLLRDLRLGGKTGSVWRRAARRAGFNVADAHKGRPRPGTLRERWSQIVTFLLDALCTQDFRSTAGDAISKELLRHPNPPGGVFPVILYARAEATSQLDSYGD